MSDVENPGNNFHSSPCLSSVLTHTKTVAKGPRQRSNLLVSSRSAIIFLRNPNMIILDEALERIFQSLGKDYIDLRHRCGDNLKFYNEDGLEEIQEKAREYITGGKIVQSKAKKSKHSTKLIFVMSTDKLYVVFSELQE
ncbi:hypothetical protein G4B88_017194 [Cannabis sativa]|uniref:Uncharacterized protein n=1 Tax=Cannabis sativa TaxID=3483 RepID=A0A7J6G0J4_CANSA|nr:hypothetical protein G4B88_017194 [Cannabis sativa]